MLTTGETIKLLRSRLGLSQAQLGELLRKSKEVISGYECDRVKLTGKVAAELAAALGCTADDLLHGRLPGEQHPDSVVVSLRSRLHQPRAAFRNAEVVGDAPTHDLPVVGMIPCGTPLDIEGASREAGIEATFRCREEDWERADFVLRVSGDSMSPMFLDGDWLAFTTKREPKTGDYVCALVANAVTFKEYRIVQGRPLLMPLNGQYDPILDDFAVQGVYVWMHRDA